MDPLSASLSLPKATWALAGSEDGARFTTAVADADRPCDDTGGADGIDQACALLSSLAGNSKIAASAINEFLIEMMTLALLGESGRETVAQLACVTSIALHGSHRRQGI